MHRSPLFANPRISLSRRGLLAMSATGLLVAGCGGGQGPGSSNEAGVGGFTGEDYAGAALSLAYWNGFTGGDGPAMQALVQSFMDAHDNITVENNTADWADFYQRLPAATQAGKGPDMGVMHLDQIATNAARSVIAPLDDLAEAIGLAESDFAASVWSPGIYQDQRYSIPLDV
ncbi:MAG: extracellular solute-binding protein, partial [Nocardioides sp.]